MNLIYRFLLVIVYNNSDFELSKVSTITINLFNIIIEFIAFNNKIIKFI